jgi:hypothetical protein
MMCVHENIKRGKYVSSNSILKVCFFSRSIDWNTPPHIVQLVLNTMGKVDLEPCSNTRINPNIPGSRLYTITESGLEKTWTGRVYVNPPYGREASQCWRMYQNRCQEFVALGPSCVISLRQAERSHDHG